MAVAKAFAEAGDNVAIWYNRNGEAVEKAAGIEISYGVKCNSARPRVSNTLFPIQT